MKPVKVSKATPGLLVRVRGELQAQLGRGLTFDEAIQVLVDEDGELKTQSTDERRCATRGPATSAEREADSR